MLSHILLLKKLEVYGIRGLGNKWFESYMANRCLQVKCRTLSRNITEISNKNQITYGTAQGSCLGPLLFNVFCNDIHLNIEHCNLIMFADDTTLYASHRNKTYLNYMLQEDLTNLDKWFEANLLSLNLTKTVAMKFWNEPFAQKDTLQFKLDNTILPLVNQMKFLGVTIDSNLQWTEHINNVISKISLNKNLIG